MAVLLDLVHVEQQRRQRPVQLPGDRRSRLVRRPGARGRELDNFKMVFERRDAAPSTLKSANHRLDGLVPTYNCFIGSLLFQWLISPPVRIRGNPVVRWAKIGNRQKSRNRAKLTVSDDIRTRGNRISVRHPRSFAEIAFTFLIAPSLVSPWIHLRHGGDGPNVVHNSPSPARSLGAALAGMDGRNRSVECARQAADIATATRYGRCSQETLKKPARGDKPEPPIGHPPRTHLSHPHRPGRLTRGRGLAQPPAYPYDLLHNYPWKHRRARCGHPTSGFGAKAI